MKYFMASVLTLLAVSPALPNNEEFLKNAVGALQQQRNEAADKAIVCEAKAAGIAADLAKAQARVKELEEKYEAKKPEEKPEGK